jgi:hypothetical protein
MIVALVLVVKDVSRQVASLANQNFANDAVAVQKKWATSSLLPAELQVQM